MRAALVLTLWLAGCAPPCQDLAVDLCADCPAEDLDACHLILEAVEASGVEGACEAEREVFDCGRIHE